MFDFLLRGVNNPFGSPSADVVGGFHHTATPLKESKQDKRKRISKKHKRKQQRKNRR